MLCKIIAENNSKKTGQLIKEKLQEKDVKVIHVIHGPIDENFWAETASFAGELAPMEEDGIGNKTGRKFTDIKHPWHLPSTSFSYSNTRQPLHTDGSYEAKAPDVTFFSCFESPKFGGQTIFVEYLQLLEYIRAYSTDLLDKLQNEIVTHGKGDDSKTKPIIHENKLTWNYYRCQPCSIRDEFHAFLEKYVIGGNLYQGVSLLPGEALFFKDEELLHGRNSFIGNRWLIKGGIYVR